MKERERLSNQLQQLRSHIKEFPKGKLICTKNGTRTKWYLSNGSNPIYIPKKQFQKAQALAIKKYYLLQIEEISQKLKAIEKCLSTYQKCPQNAKALLLEDSPYLDLLQPYFQIDDQFSAWVSADYPRNANYPEHLIHKCISGDYVRSKSEVIIANTLLINKIPFRYECGLEVSGIDMFPDFTILHPTTGEIFYWEHFGLMSNSSYRDNAYNKLKIYGDNDFIPSVNLITTFETALHPIDSGQVKKIVEEYFL